jgi:seryl-tRNA synthetase
LIDLKAARADPEAFRAAVARKGAGEAFDRVLEADASWRELIPRVDELRGRQKIQGKPSPEQVEELKQVKEELRRLEDELSAAEEARDELLQKVPNPPHESVPDEATEEEGEVVRIVGDPPELAEPKEHLELGRFDMERAARVSGSRFGYLVGDTALLSLALYRWALDRAVAAGFTPVLPPVLVREEAMYGTGFFPAEKNEYYEIGEDGLYLTGTSEVALAVRSLKRTSCRSATRRSRRTSGARRALPAATPAGCSASISSTRWRCSRTRPRRLPGTSSSASSSWRRKTCRSSAFPTGC